MRNADSTGEIWFLLTFRMMRLNPISASLPSKLCDILGDANPIRASFEASAKLLSHQLAMLFSRLEWWSKRNCLINLPVLISTGQFIAHRPSVAQVSLPSYW